MSGRLRVLVACLATAVVLAPLTWMWMSSLLPDEYSVMEMGYADFGDGSVLVEGAGHAGLHAGGADITTFVDDPDRPADVKMHLVAEEKQYRLPSGRTVDGFALNGTSPGPDIRADEGDMVEVTVDNRSVSDGMTLHWHGIDVPNAMDGVAGVTQDAIAVGKSYTYRFVAAQVGTYWYHSHQVSHEQVKGGLYGAVVITPKDFERDVVDVIALRHTYLTTRTVNGLEEELVVDARPGQTVRVRVINTDNAMMPVWVGAPYRMVAVDGTDVNEPTLVEDRWVEVTAGGRADLEIVMPEDGSGVRVELGGSSAVVLGGDGPAREVDQSDEPLDLLDYGTPAPMGFDPTDATREFEYVIDRRPGFLDGRPGLWWTVNGHLYPDIPMFILTEDDIATMRIENNSGEAHPMHLHGHHVVVLARDGEKATGSPWWTDSLHVREGESYDVAFLADNPGVWMDHCHNLTHAAEGLVAHMMYEGVTTPYIIGKAKNEPE